MHAVCSMLVWILVCTCRETRSTSNESTEYQVAHEVVISLIWRQNYSDAPPFGLACINLQTRRDASDKMQNASVQSQTQNTSMAPQRGEDANNRTPSRTARNDSSIPPQLPPLFLCLVRSQLCKLLDFSTTLRPMTCIHRLRLRPLMAQASPPCLPWPSACLRANGALVLPSCPG